MLGAFFVCRIGVAQRLQLRTGVIHKWRFVDSGESSRRSDRNSVSWEVHNEIRPTFEIDQRPRK